jgi:DNA-binding response OmpR family regulator
MDVQMPVLDGYEATKLLRQDPLDAVRGILVIAMTASAIQGDREKCIASGMDDYLAKPVRSTVLKKKLDHYLQQVIPPTPLSLRERNQLIRGIQPPRSSQLATVGQAGRERHDGPVAA